jgi:aminoglycoside 6'-N-acetyltransferase I
VVQQVRLLDMRSASRAQTQAAAQLLIDALAHAPSAWKDERSAAAEVVSFLHDDERHAIIALIDDDVVGWIGAIRQSEYAWEMHPLVVAPQHQRRGIGRQLVAALEAKARQEDVVTIWLGTDDDFGGTNLFGRNLYPNVLGALQQLRSTAGHPFAFYEKLGYTVTGVFPDVDGPGRHDILMARRISTQT